MNAEILREAAEKLRGLVGTPSEESEDFTIPGPWGVSGRPGKFEVVPELDESYDVVARTEYELEARYIATMHPGVGLALAVVLEEQANAAQSLLDAYADEKVLSEETLDTNLSVYAECVALARLILGSAS